MAFGAFPRGGVNGRWSSVGRQGCGGGRLVVSLCRAGLGVGGRALCDAGARLVCVSLLHASIGATGAAPRAGVCTWDVEVDAVLAALGVALAGLAPYAPLVAEVTGAGGALELPGAAIGHLGE